MGLRVKDSRLARVDSLPIHRRRLSTEPEAHAGAPAPAKVRRLEAQTPAETREFLGARSLLWIRRAVKGSA